MPEEDCQRAIETLQIKFVANYRHKYQDPTTIEYGLYANAFFVHFRVATMTLSLRGRCDFDPSILRSS